MPGAGGNLVKRGKNAIKKKGEEAVVPTFAHFAVHNDAKVVAKTSKFRTWARSAKDFVARNKGVILALGAVGAAGYLGYQYGQGRAVSELADWNDIDDRKQNLLSQLGLSVGDVANEEGDVSAVFNRSIEQVTRHLRLANSSARSTYERQQALSAAAYFYLACISSLNEDDGVLMDTGTTAIMEQSRMAQLGTSYQAGPSDSNVMRRINEIAESGMTKEDIVDSLLTVLANDQDRIALA